MREYILKCFDNYKLQSSEINKYNFHAGCNLLKHLIQVQPSNYKDEKSLTLKFFIAKELCVITTYTALWASQVGSLGWEDPLEKEMATHSSILA